MTSDELKLQEELHSVAARVSRVEALAKENKTQNETIIANTQEIINLVNAFKGAWIVLDGLGKLAKPVLWMLAVLAGFSAGWAWIKDHRF